MSLTLSESPPQIESKIKIYCSGNIGIDKVRRDKDRRGETRVDEMKRRLCQKMCGPRGNLRRRDFPPAGPGYEDVRGTICVSRV